MWDIGAGERCGTGETSGSEVGVGPGRWVGTSPPTTELLMYIGIGTLIIVIILLIIFL